MPSEAPSPKEADLISRLMDGFADPYVDKLTWRAAAEISRLDAALSSSQARIASAKTVIEDLIMSWVDDGLHGGNADDPNCEICATIRSGQDWLRALTQSHGDGQ